MWEKNLVEIAAQIFNNLFFSSERYDLSDVGRVKMNSRLGLQCSDKIRILRNDEINFIGVMFMQLTIL